MSQNFTKALDPYEDNQHKPVKGKYHFAVPLDIEPACYTMNIDYESHDKVNSDAYQYDGYIVVGHRAYLKTSPIIIPYQTSATSEDAVTLYEKRNTSFNLVMEAFKNTELTNAIKTLPIYFRVLKGQFKDYYANPSTARKTIDTDFNNAYVSPTITLPKSTDTNGKVTANVKVSDIYSTSETINDINTVIFKCIGTRDRKTDNYVPVNIEAPLIIGTTNVYLQNTSEFTHFEANPTGVTLPDVPQWGMSTCGHGELEIDIDVLYAFAMHEDSANSKMKYHYEDYRTDRSKMVKVGSFQLQYQDSNDNWITVPAYQLKAADANTTILSDGTIIQKVGHENGGIKFKWTNPFISTTKKWVWYRLKYTGKPGATYSQYSNWWGIAIAPQFGTPVAYDTRVVMNQSSYEGSPNADISICGKLQQKQGNEWIDANEGKGQVTITFSNGTTETANVNANGTFCVTVNKGSGTYPVTVSFHDPSGLYEDASVTTTIKIESKETEILLTNNPIVMEIGETGILRGRVVLKDGNSHVNMTNARGEITVQGEGTVTVNADGTFQINIGQKGCGLHLKQVTYHDSTAKYTDSQTEAQIYVRYITRMTLNPSTLTVLNGDTYSISGHITLNNGIQDVTQPMEGTVKNNHDNNTFTVNEGGNFTITGNVPFNKDTVCSIEYLGTNLFKPCNSSFTVTSTSYTTRMVTSQQTIEAYSTGVNDSQDFTVTVKDQHNNIVPKGTLKLFLKPAYYLYENKIEPILVKSVSVGSTGVVSLNSFSLITTSLKQEFRNRGWNPYINYSLTAEYTDSSGSYESSTIMNNTTVWYHPKTPKLQLKVWAKSPSTATANNRPHTNTYNNTSDLKLDQTITTFTPNGIITPTPISVPANSDVKVQLQVLDDNERIGGIRIGSWITHEHDIPIYVQEENGDFKLTENGNKIPHTTLKRTVKVEEPIIDPDTGQPQVDPNTGEVMTQIVDQETPILANPCYAGIPLPEYTLLYSQDPAVPDDTAPYDRPFSYYFRLPEEVHDTSTFHINLTYYAMAIFGLFSNNVVLPTESMPGGLNANHEYAAPVNHKYGVIINLDFESP